MTVVPVVRIRGGGGLGGAKSREPHQTNGGIRSHQSPRRAWMVTESGKVQWQPAIDVSRIAIFGRWQRP